VGDKRRFDLFARFIAFKIPVSMRADLRVADVAAGRGYLSFALREHGFRRIVPFEPFPRRCGQVYRLNIQVREFNSKLAEGFDLLVGMHPDGATDCILDGAAKFGAMAIISPCCIRPNAWVYWGDKLSHKDWQAHLKKEAMRRGLELQEDRLPMTGANVVLYGGNQLSKE
jgi:hypothetical protein